MPTHDQNGSWSEWRRLVLKELERCSTERKELEQKIDALSDAVLVMQVKAGVISAIAGVVVTLLLAIFKH